MMAELINTGVPAVSSSASSGGHAMRGETRVHKLKTWPEFFEPVFQGKKNFEVRFNDRKFQVGEIVHFLEYIPAEQRYTGREVRKISYIIRDNKHVADGYVILSLQSGNV